MSKETPIMPIMNFLDTKIANQKNSVKHSAVRDFFKYLSYRTADRNYTIYQFEGNLQGTQWTFELRYSAFNEFHQQLKGVIPHLPHLPSKRLFGNLNEGFIEKRGRSLAEYLNQLAVLLRCPEVGWRMFVVFMDQTQRRSLTCNYVMAEEGFNL